MREEIKGVERTKPRGYNSGLDVFQLRERECLRRSHKVELGWIGPGLSAQNFMQKAIEPLCELTKSTGQV